MAPRRDPGIRCPARFRPLPFLIPGLIGLFFVVFPLASQAEALPPQDLLIQAKAELEASHYARAETLLRELLGHQPAHVEASFLLGVSLAKQEKWVAAGQALEHAIDLNPRLAPAHLELAGVRHRQGANQEAMRLLRRTISLDRGNHYARYFLATLSYLEDRRLEALYHWNAVGEPRIHEISYLTPSQTKLRLIGQLFHLNEGEVLRREQLMDIRWVQERLRLRTDFDWLLQPVSKDQWDLEISMSQQSSSPSKKTFWLAKAPGIAFNQEVFAEFQNDRGQSFGGGVRWDRHRKQAIATSSFPFLFSASDVLRLGGDVRDEAWRHTESGTDFTLQTASLSGSYEHSFRGRRSLSFHAGYRHQDSRFDQGTFPSQSPHVVTLGLEWNQRIDLNPQDSRQLHWATRLDQINLLGDTRQGTYRLATRVRVNWSLREKSRTNLGFSLQGGISGDPLPLDDYFSLGVGPDHPLPLRAHTTLQDGRKGNNPLGREFALANVEFSHRLLRWRFFEVKGFTFSDIALVGRPPFGASGQEWFHDAGGGLRLGFFGHEVVHLVLGWDLKNGSFNQWIGLPSRDPGVPQ